MYILLASNANGICIVGKKGCKIIAKTLAKKIKSDKTIAPLNQKKIQE